MDFHNDTHGIEYLAGLSIHFVSDTAKPGSYHLLMAKKRDNKWGPLLRDELKTRGISPGTAARNANISEPTLRSWINGHREPNVGAFLRLCKANGLDPSVILFGDEPTDKDVSRRALRLAAKIDAIKDTESGRTALVLIERIFITETAAGSKVKTAYKTSERPRIRGRLVEAPTQPGRKQSPAEDE